MTILDLREKIPHDIFSSLELNDAVKGYRNPRAKIAALLRQGVILSLRRGLYIFAEPLRREPVSVGVLANRIHGPSYVSGDYALSFYGLIPEKTQIVTSTNLSRSREFATAFGVFSYRHCGRPEAYSIGVTRAGAEQARFMIATPEKALFDKVSSDRRFDGGDPEAYLSEDLRIDLAELRKRDRSLWRELAPFMTGKLHKFHRFLEAL